MTGVDLLRMIRADPKLQHIPAVAITALNAPDNGSFVESGFDLHIRKPVDDTDELVRTLEQIINKRGLWSE